MNYNWLIRTSFNFSKTRSQTDHLYRQFEKLKDKFRCFFLFAILSHLQINDRVLQNILVAATLPSYGLRSIEKYIEKRFPLVSDHEIGRIFLMSILIQLECLHSPIMQRFKYHTFQCFFPSFFYFFFHPFVHRFYYFLFLVSALLFFISKPLLSPASFLPVSCN